LSSSVCSSLARQEKSKTRAWFELVTSLKIVFELELVRSQKFEFGLAWLDQLVKPKSSLISSLNLSSGQVFKLEI